MYIQDPDSDLDWIEDWATWLGADTIASVVWSTVGTITLHTTSSTATTTTTWISELEHGKRARATAKITTAAGRVAERSTRIMGFSR